MLGKRGFESAVKRIEIYERNLGKLNKQKSYYGPAEVPLSLDNNIELTQKEIAGVENEIREMQAEMLRRLQELTLKKARFGISVDPSVIIEIEDIEQVVKEIGVYLGKRESPVLPPAPDFYI